MPDITYGHPLPVATLAASILAATPEQQRMIWTDQAIASNVTQNPFRNHRGGKTALIETRNDETKEGGMGDTIRFPLTNQYWNVGKHGDTPFLQTEYEADELKDDFVKVGLVSNATSDSKYNRQMLPEEILSGKAAKMGDWMGRKEFSDIAHTHIHLAHPSSKFILGHDNLSQLTSADELSYDSILNMAGFLRPRGGTPVVMKVDRKGSVMMGYHVLASTNAWTALKHDPDVKEMHLQAAPRTEENPLYTGELYNIDGNMIQHWSPVDHTEAGPIGSAYEPRAFLGTAIAAGGTSGALAILGGRNLTNAAKLLVPYYQDFPCYAYPFANNTILDISASPLSALLATGEVRNTDFWGYRVEAASTWDTTPYFYVTIVNPPDAPTDPNKWGFYRVGANDGNRLSVAVGSGGRRLSATNTIDAFAADIRATTVGGVTFDSAVNTEVHPAGAMVFLASPNGIPLCTTPMFGAGALRRGQGIWDNFRHEDPPVQGRFRHSYIYSVFGHAMKRNFGGETPGVVNLIHTYSLKGWKLPTI